MCSNQLSYVAKFIMFFDGWGTWIRTGNAGIKTGALPLGDTPITVAVNRKHRRKWLGYLDSNQGMPVSKPVPYRLAIPQQKIFTSR